MSGTSAQVFVRQITQVLSVEKLALGFFLGAGCPFSVRIPSQGQNGETIQAPLIPDVTGLTKLIVAEFASHAQLKSDFQKLLDALKDDAIVDPNIEQILGFVRTLTAAAGTGTARGLEAAILRKMDKVICESILQKVNKRLPPRDTAYHALAQFVAPRRKNPVEIFTTNYDLLIEQALEGANVPFFDGFVGSYQPFFDLVAIEQDVLPPRWARLWKVHGSVNWRKPEETGSRVCRTLSSEVGGDLLIHPSHQKFDDSRRMPYLALIDRLRNFIKNDLQPVALVVQGFSFSDDHLNAAIEEGLRANPHAACFAFQFGDLDNYPRARRLAGRCSNLTILARDRMFSRGIERNWEITQSPSNASISGLFEWDQASLEGADKSTNARLKLGDFEQFGLFLRSLAGIASDEVGAAL